MTAITKTLTGYPIWRVDYQMSASQTLDSLAMACIFVQRSRVGSTFRDIHPSRLAAAGVFTRTIPVHVSKIVRSRQSSVETAAQPTARPLRDETVE